MKLLVFYIFTGLISSCVFEKQHDLNVLIINHSSYDIYVGEFDNCDSCVFKIYSELYCKKGGHQQYFPQVIKKGNFAEMRTNMKNIEKIGFMNLDSLNKYCSRKSGFKYDKNWMQVLASHVDTKSKECKFIITN